MKRKIVIRFAKLRKYSKNNISKIIVVAYNNSPTNGGHIEKIGTYSKFEKVSDSIGMISTINLRRLVYWIKRGAYIQSKASRLIGILGHGERK